jgi:hypothetical protein
MKTKRGCLKSRHPLFYFLNFIHFFILIVDNYLPLRVRYFLS